MTVRDARGLGLVILVAEGAGGAYEPVAVVGTVREAIEVSHDDLAGRMRRVEAGDDPLCPELYVLWSRNQEGAYRRRAELNAVTLDARTRSLHRSTGGAPDSYLVIADDGFLNLNQACEFRLRYVDVTTTDGINGIDVFLANGRSHLVAHGDPGFDQVVAFLEDQGYTISVADEEGSR